MLNDSWCACCVTHAGLIDAAEGGPFKLEADQGDSMSGVLNRDEAATVLCQALATPEAVGKTFEVGRRQQGQ